MSESAVHARAGGAPVAAYGAIALALGVLLLRACVGMETLTGWETDPLLDPAPSSGLTPGLSIAVDAVSVVASGVALLLFRGRVAPVSLCVWGVVALVIAYHAVLASHADLQHLRIGAAWLSAITLGVVLSARGVGTDRGVRSLVCGCLGGFAALLVCKGALQVFVEQPAMIASFKQNSTLFFQSQGWEPGSTMARAYERRVNQTEATGWFGLSNVFASVCAAMVPIGLACGFGAWRAKRAEREEAGDPDRASAGLGLIAACGVTTALAISGVIMAGGKGGYVAMALGLGVLLGLAVLVRRATDAGRGRLSARLAGGLGVACVVGALGAIAARGVVGERLSELSIWFRAFYIEASLRIFGERPLLGVGPDGFKDAYTRLKNPLSPEEVASPHSIFFDWGATLGAAGVALGVLVLWWAWRCGAGLVETHVAQKPEADAPAPDERTLARLICAVAAAVVLSSLSLERAALGPAQGLMMVIGLVLWCVLGTCAMKSVMRDGFAKIGIAAGAIAMLTHAQIEVTGSWTQSSGLLLALVGLAASGAGVSRGATTSAGDAPDSGGGTARWRVRAPGVVVILMGIGLAFAATAAIGFDRALQKAAEPLRAIALARMTARLESDRSVHAGELQRMVEDAAARLEIETGTAVPATPSGLVNASDRAEPTLIRNAARALEPDALRTWLPSIRDWRIERERKRLNLHIACRVVQSDSAAATASGRDVFFRPTDERERGYASKIAWDATAAGALLDAGVPGVVTRQEHVRMLDAATRADSGNTRHWMMLLRVLRDRVTDAEVPDRGAALKAAAQGALRADERMRLDRATRGLTDAERREVDAVLIRP